MLTFFSLEAASLQLLHADHRSKKRMSSLLHSLQPATSTPEIQAARLLPGWA
jgi:hypothetical protein